MGVVTVSSLRRAALARFGIDACGLVIEPLGYGLINDSWQVSLPGTGPQYVLQRINNTVFPDALRVMANSARVGRHLFARYRHYPDPQRRCLLARNAVGGDPWWLDRQGDYWRVFDFIADSLTVQHIDSVGIAFQTGLGFGRFVADLDDLPGPPLHETIAGFHDTVGHLYRLRQALADVPTVAHAIVTEVQRIQALSWLPDRLAALDAEAPMPRRVVHNDTKVDNLLFDRHTGEALCVIDLDTVMPGLVVYDYGDMIRNGTGNISDAGQADFSLERFAALTDGYLTATGSLLGASERAFFPLAGPLLALELASRFLTDHLRGNSYFKVSFEAQNLLRCRQQLDLAEAMLAQTEAMQDIVADVSARHASA